MKAHHVSRLALVLAGIFAAVLFFVLGALLRLLIGPVSLGPFGNTLSQAIQGALPGITLKYDQAAVEWSRDEGRVNLVILGARVFDADGRIIAQAPKADIDLAAAPFLQGRIAVQRITLVGVQLTLVRMRDGGIRLGVEKDHGQQDIIARLNDVIKLHSHEQSTLKSFAVRNARIAIYDEQTGIFLVAPRANLAITTKDDGIGTSFDADVEISGRAAHLKADFTLPAEAGPVVGDAGVTGLDLRALGSNAPLFAPLRKIALLVDLTTHFSIASGSHLAAADFKLDAHGEIPVPGMIHGPLHVQALSLAGHYDGNRNRLSLDQGVLKAREASAQLRGAGDFSYNPQGALSDVRFDLGLGKVALDMPGVFAAPVSLQNAVLRGDYLPPTRDVVIDRFTALGPGLDFDAAGKVTLADTGAPAMALKGKMAALPVAQFLRYWPIHLGEGTRDWIARNISSGTVGPFAFQTDLAAGMLDQPQLPDNALNLSFGMKNVQGTYIKGLTQATQIQGSAVLTGDNFHAAFPSGRIGALVLSRGTAAITDLHVHGALGVISVHVDGAMPDIMTLIDMKPLGYPTRFGIKPSETGGTASADLAFKVPMLRELPVSAIGISVKAAVNNFAVTLGHTRITDGAVNFLIDNDHLRQTGMVSLADSRLAVDWTENFNTRDFVTTRLLVKGVVKDGARSALNLGLEDIVAGPVDVTGTLTGHRGSLKGADLSLDLTQATLAVGFVGLGKPAGNAASAHVTADFAPGDLVQDETVKIAGPGIAANGTILFDRNGALTSLNFPSVKMGPLNDLSFAMTRSAAGVDYEVRGHSLDGSRIGHEGAGGTGTGAPRKDDMPEGPFHIDARLDRLMLRDGVAIAPFALDVGGIGSRPASLTLSGNLSRTAPISGNIDASGGARRLTLAAGATGLLLRGLFGFTSMKGGKLALTATLPGKASDGETAPGIPDYQGTLTVSDFMVVNQPFLSRLFSAGSLTGIADLMQGDGISVEKMEVPFSSRNNVISVHDARAAGRAIGATADGYIDRPKNVIALKGSLVPAYGLNSMLGVIPVLGDLLVSKKGEGVFGITYSAHGNADQPDISVNPLALLTPGIVRRIMEGNMPNAANAPSNAPPPKPAPPAPKPD